MPWLISVSILAVGLVAGCTPSSGGLDSQGKSAASVTEIVDDGHNQAMIASSTRSMVAKCTVTQMVTTFSCAGVPVLPVNARKMPFIARNTVLAWQSGLPPTEKEPVEDSR
jgi:hypothetical protein